MKEITLTHGYTTLIDDGDFEYLSQWKWCYKEGYATRSQFVKGSKGKWSFIRMHRLITDCPRNLEVDHINRNKLDNQRSNLRIVTRQMNMANTGIRKNNKSGYKGVTAYGKRFRAFIMVNYKQMLLGTYDTAEEASVAYRKAADEHFGQYARYS